MSSLVRLETNRGIATITLDSPQNRNALSVQLVEELVGAFGAAGGDPAVRGIVLTGEGSVFCSGADLKHPPDTEPGRGVGYPAVIATIMDSPKVVVGAINGHVRAGGIGLVAACDVVVAPDDATFAFAEVRIGVAPAVISVVCRRVMSPRALQRYLLVGEVFDAAGAFDAGLVTIVVPRVELDQTVAELCDALRLTAPNAVARTKELLRELETLELVDGFAHAAAVSAELFESDEGREGIAAFRQKRSPSWVP